MSSGKWESEIKDPRKFGEIINKFCEKISSTRSFQSKREAILTRCNNFFNEKLQDKKWVNNLSSKKIIFMEKIASNTCVGDTKCLEKKNEQAIEQFLIQECKYLLKDLLLLEKRNLSLNDSKNIEELIEWDPGSAFAALQIQDQPHKRPKHILTYIKRRLKDKQVGLGKQFIKGLDGHSYRKMLELDIIKKERLEELLTISKKELEDLYHEKQLSIDMIASMFGVSSGTLRNRMVELGIPRRGKGFLPIGKPVSKEGLKRLYWDEELSLVEIGNKFNVTPSTILRWMEEFGIPRREKGYKRVKIPISKRELKRLYLDEKLSVKKIGEMFNVPHTTMLRWMEEFGIPRRKASLPMEIPISKKELRRLYWDEKLSTSQLGEKFNVSPTTICHWMEEFGMPRRGFGTPAKTPISKEELKKLYWGENLTVEEIGKLFNVTGTAILLRMKEYGIPRRKTGRRGLI